MSKRSTVGDSKAALVEELLMLSFNNHVVVVNGGLGPTTDDLSAEAAAEAAEQPLVLFSEWETRMRAFFSSRQREMPVSNLKQAMLPANAEIIDNPVGTACGFRMTINDCLFYFTPGVPHEFKRMTDEQILPDLSLRFPDVQGQKCSRIYTFGIGESGIADILDKLILPEGFTLGYRSYMPFIEVKLFGPKSEVEARSRLLQLIHQHLEKFVVSVEQPMLVHLGALMADKGQSLALAEQSTQGWLSDWLSDDERIENLFGHGWVLRDQVASKLGEQDPLTASLALAGATKEKCQTQLALVTGPLSDGKFTIGLSAPEGEWGMMMEFSRQFSRRDQKMLIGTIAADLLRRYLAGKPMFVSYSVASVLKEVFLPASLLNGQG